MPTLHRVIVRPVITEQTSLAYQEKGEYVFEVHPDANKQEIKQAIERLFGVKVSQVWTMNVRGKTRRVGTSIGRRPHWKKAIVTLREGTIDTFGFEG
ncbi:MAG TPA: 50S ribosomal protein L23 [Archangium sp.]